MARRTIVGFDSVDGLKKVATWAREASESVGTNRVPRGIDPGGDDVSVMGVYNGDSTDCPAFGIMLQNGSHDTSDWYVDKGKRPDTYGCQWNFLVATSDGVKANSGGGVQSGAGPIGNRYIVAYDNSDGTPAAGENWGPRSGTYLAKKNTGGFRVIKAFDTTNHYMLVTAEPMLTLVGQFGSDVGTDANGSLTIYTGTNGSETTTSVTQSNVWNGSSCTVKANKRVVAHWLQQNQSWSVVEAHTS